MRSAPIAVITFVTCLATTAALFEPPELRWTRIRGGAPVEGRPAPTPRDAPEPDEEAEERNAARRRQWFEERHRHAPGTDWRAIERENGLQQMARRRAGARTQGQWIERGSENQAGSMYAVAPATGDGRIFAGSAMGGLWRGEGTGTGWEPLSDGVYGGAHRIAIAPGEPEAWIVATDGGLIHRSTDGGASWWPVDGVAGDHQALRRLTRSTDHLLWLVMGASWGGSATVYRSDDRGASFVEVLDLDGRAGDLWAPRVGDLTVYVASDVLRVSTDGGTTWEVRGTLPAFDHIELAGSEAGRLYAMVDSRALWRSDDDGWTWTEQAVAVQDDWGRLDASITDPDLVVWGGVEVFVSRDGGASAAKVNAWWAYYDDPSTKLHADLMATSVLPTPEGGEQWYLGTHGGVYRSDDQLRSVTNMSLSGLRVSQYYDTLTSVADPAHVLAGSQDQGWQRAGSADAADTERFAFDQLESGDYGQLTSADGTHTWVFSVYPGFVLVHHGETDPELFFLNFPADATLSPWMPAVVADPRDRTDVFLGGGRLWHYDKQGDDWLISQASWRNFEESPGEYLSQFAFAPSAPERGYGVTSRGRMFRTDDTGGQWSLQPVAGPSGSWLYGAAVGISRANADEVLVGGSGYDSPPVFRTDDGGATWSDWSQGLPPTLVYALCEAPDGSGDWFAGTETSAWRRGRADDAWVDITSGTAPITIYWSCESLFHENTIRFGTHGRGIWDYRISAYGEGCFPARDDDGDGSDCALDCDDADDARAPGLPDACDGVDQNCDGADESDQDGDGVRVCADCDDDSAARSPAAVERCGDGIDQDCDGVDAPCPNAGGCACATTPTGGSLGWWFAFGAAGWIGRRRGVR